MAELELQKENIEYEQFLGQGTSDAVVRGEFLIPDTHPDVLEILMLDVRPVISNKEVMQDKVYVEGQLNYNVLYLAREDENMGVHSVNYSDKFSSYIDISGVEYRMNCEIECYVEHINSSIINERKIGVEGILTIRSDVFNNCNIPIVRDIIDSDEIQTLRNPAEVDRLVCRDEFEMPFSSNVQIPMDKPQIDKILKQDLNIHKQDITLSEGKVNISAFVKIDTVYRTKDSQELYTVQDDVYVNKEFEVGSVNDSMMCLNKFNIGDIEIQVEENDLGENRILNLDSKIVVDASIITKEQYDVIEDAYSPKSIIEIDKEKYKLNVLHGHNSTEIIVKDNIELSKDEPLPVQILTTKGNVIITDKKIIDNKLMIDGVVKVNVLYKNNVEDKCGYSNISEELPFSTFLEIQNIKEDMQFIVKSMLESIEASIEANTIAVKAIIHVCGYVMYSISKDILTSVNKKDEAKPEKKASLTIYIVQPGDNLWSIAKHYSTTVEQLISLNGIDPIQLIKPGDKLLIPGRALI